MSRVHAGLWTDCKNCNADWKPKKRDRKDVKPKYTSGEVSVDIAIRRQIAAELGEEEPNKDVKFALLQKYGAAAARIDRGVTKPAWQEENIWNQQKAQYDNVVRGLVPREVRPASTAKGSRPWSEIRHKNPQAQARHEQKYGSLNKSLRSYSQTRTETRRP